MTEFSAHVVATARRVKQERDQRVADYDRAYREWSYKPTLSNAVRRDDAKTALLDLADANTLALTILAQTE